MTINDKKIAIYEIFYMITSIDYKYYNIVSTDECIILDFLNRSFKPWIIRSGVYKINEYEDLTIEDIKKRNKENIVIVREDIVKIKFYNRTFLKNAYVRIDLKNNETPLILATKNKLYKNIEF